MKLSMIAAESLNRVIGYKDAIPWKAKGELLIFKAVTYNQWIIVGRKTFESMGALPGRKYVVLTNNPDYEAKGGPDVYTCSSVNGAMGFLRDRTDHVIVCGGEQIYRYFINDIDVLHLSSIGTDVQGDTYFPGIPGHLQQVYQQKYTSNIDYTHTIYARREWGN